MESTKPMLSNVQIELLKLYANNISEADLREIKLMLSNYFANKASDAMDQFCAEQNLSPQNIMAWANEHNRAENRS